VNAPSSSLSLAKENIGTICLALKPALEALQDEHVHVEESVPVSDVKAEETAGQRLVAPAAGFEPAAFCSGDRTSPTLC
jgi:hypothetical protein